MSCAIETMGNCSGSKRQGRPLPVTIRIHFASHPILHPPSSSEGKNKFARIPVTFHEDKFRTRNCRRIPISRASSTPCLPIWSPIQPTYARERNSASAGPRARCIESTSQTEPRIDPVNTDGVVSVIDRPPPPHCPCQISPVNASNSFRHDRLLAIP